MGNILTIITIVIGLAIQYTAIIKQFSERITKIESNVHGFEKVQDVKHQTIDKYINILFEEIKHCKQYKGDGCDGHKV